MQQRLVGCDGRREREVGLRLSAAASPGSLAAAEQPKPLRSQVAPDRGTSIQVPTWERYLLFEMSSGKAVPSPFSHLDMMVPQLSPSVLPHSCTGYAPRLHHRKMGSALTDQGTLMGSKFIAGSRIVVMYRVHLLPRVGVRPCGWTISGGGFDLLAGVLILEGYGAEIAKG